MNPMILIKTIVQALIALWTKDGKGNKKSKRRKLVITGVGAALSLGLYFFAGELPKNVIIAPNEEGATAITDTWDALSETEETIETPETAETSLSLTEWCKAYKLFMQMWPSEGTCSSPGDRITKETEAGLCVFECDDNNQWQWVSSDD